MADSKERDAKLKKELADLLHQSFPTHAMPVDSDGHDASVVDATPETFDVMAESPANTTPVDSSIQEKQFRAKAESFIDSMFKFYIKSGLIGKSEYLEAKSNLNSANMTNIFLQIDNTKLIMNRLLSELNSGNLNPRLVESYCTLNSQLSDMIKAQANYVLFLEDTYKKSRVEVIENNNMDAEEFALTEGENSQSEMKSLPEAKKKMDGEFYITSDAKSLMDEIQSDKDAYYEDAKNGRSDYLISDEDSKDLINPTNKEELIDKYNVNRALLDEELSTEGFESSIDSII